MPDELFPGSSLPKAPTRLWLAQWDRHLHRMKLLLLSKKEAKMLASGLSRLWKDREREADLITCLIDTWFAGKDKWGRETGFSPEAFFRWTRKAMLEMDETKRAQQRISAQKALDWKAHKAISDFSNGLPPEISKERIKEIRKTIRKINEEPDG